MRRLAEFIQQMDSASHTSEAARRELIIAVGRALLAVSALVAIYIDPTEPTLYAPVAYGLMAAYVVYSVIIYWQVRKRGSPSNAFRLWVYLGDIAWVSVITFFTQGPNSSFFVFIWFGVVAAAFRWDFWETLGTGVFFVVLTVIQGFVLTYGHFLQGEFELNRLIMRSTYLLLMSVLLGYFAHAQNRLGNDLKMKAGEMERASVAREIHDSVIQTLLAIDMEIEVALVRYPSQRELLERFRRLMKSEVLNLREMIAELRPLELNSRELVNYVTRLVDMFQRDTGIRSRFICGDTNLPFSSHVCTELGRIIQEALANIRKHSGATNVVVQLLKDEQEIWKLAILDDGRGFDFEGKLSHAEMDEQWRGPTILKERVRLIGGELTLESKPALGCSLEITIPHDGTTKKFGSY